MKKTALLLFLFSAIAFSGQAQEKYICKNGQISFYGQTPMETIDAVNQQASGVIDTKTGDVVVSAMVKSFSFKIALMEEHFNENYIESSKFPKATFKGKITNLNAIQFSKPGNYKAQIEGDLTIKGKVQKMKTEANIEVKAGKLTVKSKFKITPEDHGIEIPSVVRDKIAKQMDVSLDMAFDPMKSK
jgi:polyisoprenoid-binding protein YceI